MVHSRHARKSNFFKKKGKKTRQIYALLGGNTAVLIQMAVALIITTQLKNKTK